MRVLQVNYDYVEIFESKRSAGPTRRKFQVRLLVGETRVVERNEEISFEVVYILTS